MRYCFPTFMTLMIGFISLNNVGESLFHFSKLPRCVSQKTHRDHQGHRQSLPVKCSSKKCRPIAVDDSHKWVERIDGLPLGRHDARWIRDGRQIHPDLHYKGHRELYISILYI